MIRFGAANAIQPRWRGADQFFAAIPRASRDFSVPRQQAHDGEEQLTLAGTGFADHTQTFAGLDVETDISDRMHLAIWRGKPNIEILY